MTICRGTVHGLVFPSDCLEVILNILHMLGQQVQAVSYNAMGQQDVYSPYKQTSEHTYGKEPPRHCYRCFQTQQKHEKREDKPDKDAKAHHPDSEVGEDPFRDSYHMVYPLIEHRKDYFRERSCTEAFSHAK